VQVLSMIEFLEAAASTKFVSGPYEERGGIMLVAYPGSFKTTIVMNALEGHTDIMKLSDLNVQQWLKIRDDFITGRYSGIAFTDFEKIYQRHASTSSHIEGIIKGLVAEGYGTSPNGDNRCPTIPAYALVIGAMTNACLEWKYDIWQKSGFLRRFLWLTYVVSNQNKIHEAISRWEKIDFGRIAFRPTSRRISVEISDKRNKLLEKLMVDQPGYNGTAYTLLKKIVAVLDWKYANNNGKNDRVAEILEDIAPALTQNGGKITL